MPTNPIKKHYSYTIKDFWRQYKEKEKSEGKAVSDIISYHHYKDYFRDFFKEIFLKIIADNHIFVLPYRLGLIQVKAFNSVNLIDYHLSKKYKKPIKHINLHTYGWGFKIDWNKSFVNFRNRFYYKFRSTKSDFATKNGVGRRALSKRIKELSKDPTKRSFIRL